MNRDVEIVKDFNVDIKLANHNLDIIKKNDFDVDLNIEGFSISSSMFVTIKNHISTLIEFLEDKYFFSVVKNQIKTTANIISEKKFSSVVKNKINTSIKFIYLQKISSNVKMKIRTGKDTFLRNLDDIDLSVLDVYSLSDMAQKFGEGIYFLLEKRAFSVTKSKISTVANLSLFSLLRLNVHDDKNLSTMDMVTLQDLDRSLV